VLTRDGEDLLVVRVGIIGEFLDGVEIAEKILVQKVKSPLKWGGGSCHESLRKELVDEETLALNGFHCNISNWHIPRFTRSVGRFSATLCL
jgi:hypothetical protein